MPKKKQNKKREERKEVSTRSRRVQKPQSLTLGRSYHKAQTEIAHNAEYYVRSLFDAESFPHVRIPEAALTATSTGIAQAWVDVPIQTGTTSGFAGGIAIFPTLQGCYSTITAAVTVNECKWSNPVDHPQTSTFAADNIKGYRVVSMGVTVLDVGAWSTKGMSFMVGQWPQEWAVDSAAAPTDKKPFNISDQAVPYDGGGTTPNGNDPLTTFSQSAHFTQLDSTSMTTEHLKLMWLPATLASMTFHGSSLETSGATWRETTNTNHLFDNGLLFFAYSSAATAPSDTIKVKIHMNIEFIPQPSGVNIYEPVAVEGSRAAAAAAMGSVMDEVERGGYVDEVMQGIATHGPRIARILGRAALQYQRGGWTGALAGLAIGANNELKETKHWDNLHPGGKNGDFIQYVDHATGQHFWYMREDLEGIQGTSKAFYRVRLNNGSSVLMSSGMLAYMGYKPLGGIADRIPLDALGAWSQTANASTVNNFPQPDSSVEPPGTCSSDGTCEPPNPTGNSGRKPGTMPHSPTPGSGFVNIPRL